ncbi:uncharacterized [Tachysurus ichikawai]
MPAWGRGRAPELRGVEEEEEMMEVVTLLCPARSCPGLSSFGTLLILKPAKWLIDAEDQTASRSKSEL